MCCGKVSLKYFSQSELEVLKTYKNRFEILDYEDGITYVARITKNGLAIQSKDDWESKSKTRGVYFNFTLRTVKVNPGAEAEKKIAVLFQNYLGTFSPEKQAQARKIAQDLTDQKNNFADVARREDVVALFSKALNVYATSGDLFSVVGKITQGEEDQFNNPKLRVYDVFKLGWDPRSVLNSEGGARNLWGCVEKFS